jgi:hypothetical protein
MHSLQDATRTRTMTTDELRASFSVEGPFQPNATSPTSTESDSAALCRKSAAAAVR